MRRVITYLYEYRDGVRVKGAGFFKLDLMGDECRIQLSLPEDDASEEPGKVYFVLRDAEYGLRGVYVGEISQHRGGGNWTVSINGICGSPYSFDEVHGMAVRCASGRYMASCWDEKADEEFLRGEFAEWGKEAGQDLGDYDVADGKPKTEKESESRLGLDSDMENGGDYEKESGDVTNRDIRKEKKDKLQEEDTDIDNILQEEQMPELHVEEMPAGKEEISGQTEAQSKPEPALQYRSPCLQRVDISDIRSFPKKNWHLCSNSFLVHGFFNYHYLVRKDVEKNGTMKSYLGVPGIYARPERAMAMLFGFPEFEPEAGTDITDGSFGYWYCPLEL